MQRRSSALVRGTAVQGAVVLAACVLVVALSACRTERPNGASCLKARDCESGRCVAGRCSGPPSEGTLSAGGVTVAVGGQGGVLEPGAGGAGGTAGGTTGLAGGGGA